MASKKVDENSDQNHKFSQKWRSGFLHSQHGFPANGPNERAFKETCRTDMTVDGLKNLGQHFNLTNIFFKYLIL